MVSLAAEPIPAGAFPEVGRRTLREVAPTEGLQHSGLEEGLKRPPHEDSLIDFVGGHPAALLHYQKDGQWHTHRKNLDAAVPEAGRANQIFAFLERSHLEAYLVPNGMINGLGAWLSPETEYLYVSKEALVEADLTLIRALFAENLAPVQEWMAGRTAPPPAPLAAATLKETSPASLSAEELSHIAEAERSDRETLNRKEQAAWDRWLADSLVPGTAVPGTVPLAPIGDSIRKAASAAFQGSADRNQVRVADVALGGSQFIVWVDVEESKGLTCGFVPLHKRYKPLVPDPRSITEKPMVQKARRYAARVDISEVDKRMEGRIKNYRQFRQVAGRDLQDLLDAPEQARGRWMAQVIPMLRQILESPDSQGKALSQRIAALRAKDSRQADAFVDAVRDLTERQLRFIREMNRNLNDLETAARRPALEEAPPRAPAQRPALEEAPPRAPAQEGRVSVERARAFWAAAEGLLSAWPRLQIGVRVIRENLPSDGTVDLEGIASEADPLADEPWRETLPLLLDRFPPELIADAYYDAYRLVWLERLGRMEEAIRQGQLSVELLAQLQHLGGRVLLLEQEAIYTKLIREKASLPQSLFHFKKTIAGGVGLLLLDAEGRPRRFIPGGGAVDSSNEQSAYFYPSRLSEWIGPNDQAALLYPSWTGFPNLEQVDGFLEDLFLFQQVRPGTEVSMATVTPEGAFRMYRPAFPPGDREGWLKAKNRSAALSALHIRFVSSIGEDPDGAAGGERPVIRGDRKGFQGGSGRKRSQPQGGQTGGPAV
ncbi:MAG: hypothetical protein HYZ93_01755 [Candidatus Omnitrophica bacterium]|nr:hypothetical protein [Candidatus Omnitrophota bacterium]